MGRPEGMRVIRCCEHGTCDDTRKLVAYSGGLVLYADNYVGPWLAIPIRACQMLIPVFLQAACQRLHSGLPVCIAQPAPPHHLRSDPDQARSAHTTSLPATPRLTQMLPPPVRGLHVLTGVYPCCTFWCWTCQGVSQQGVISQHGQTSVKHVAVRHNMHNPNYRLRSATCTLKHLV